MEEALGGKVQLIAGSGGVFDVKVNDDLVYSKAVTGNFPEEDALVSELIKKFK